MKLPAAFLLASYAGLAQSPAAQSGESPAPPPTSVHWLTGYVELGDRWTTNVWGSYPEYRSTVNLGAGPRLFGLDATLADPRKRFFDSITLRAYDWGDPYNTAYLDARIPGVYDFTLDYRSMVYFNTVPSFANPLAPAGASEQSFDVLQRTAGYSLTLLPGRHVAPYLGYSHNSVQGHGMDTWLQDSSEAFTVPVLYRDNTADYQGGVRFEYRRFHATLEEGGVTFQNSDQSNFSGVNPGDSPASPPGQTQVLTDLQQAYGIRETGAYSRALMTAAPAPWADLYAQFLYSDPHTGIHFNEAVTGNFVLLSSLLSYAGETTRATGTAVGPHTSANAGFELHPWRRLRVVEWWMTDRYHDAASPLVAEQLYLTPPTAPQSLPASLNYSQIVNLNQEQVDAFLDLNGKMTLRAGYRYVWGGATVLASQLSQSGPLASGRLERNTALAAFHYRPSAKLSLSLDYEGAESDHVYFSTSLNDYSVARARARYHPLPSLSLQANFRVLNNQNPDPSIRYDFQSRDNSFAVSWLPRAGKRVVITGEYDRSTVRSRIGYLLPQFLTPDVSTYRDNAHTASSLIELMPPAILGVAPKLTLGGSLMVSSGSRPARYYQPTVQLSVPLSKHVSWNTQWFWYGLGEEFYLYEGFRTHMIRFALRFAK